MISDQEPLRALRRRQAALLARALLWLLLLAPSLIAQTPASPDILVENIRVVDDRHIDLDITFPAPPTDFDRIGSYVMPAGYSRIGIPGRDIPAFERELSMGEGSVEIVSVDQTERPVSGLGIAPPRDVPITGDSAADARAAAALGAEQIAGVWPATWAEVQAAGSMQGAPIAMLRLNPWRYDATRGRLLCARRMRLRITSTRPFDRAVVQDLPTALRSARIATRREAPRLTAAPTSQQVAPDGFEYKIFTDHDGIYRLSAKDLRDAGIPIDAIDARTLRLFADGIEQPIYLFDKGNNRLDETPLDPEYIEFFGWRKRAADVEPGSDLYFDPHTRYAVFFLTWGGPYGKRLVEESGAIGQGGDPAGDLTDQSRSFRTTIHLEDDDLSISLGNAELNTPSDRFDRHVWGRAEQNSLVTLDARIPAPDVLSSDTVRVRAALRTHLRTSSLIELENPAQTRATLFVDRNRALATMMPSMGLRFVSSDSNSVAPLTADRLRADGSSSITLATDRATDPNVLTETYLNWVELTYPRMYRAFEDSIEFRAPAGLGPRYLTFRLRGFGTPDIRVYRAGISRITNLAILTTLDQTRRDTAGATWDVQFQAFVASPDERFYATAERNITRPLVMRDSSADLLSPSNEASYVVIVSDATADLAHYADPGHPLRRFKEFKERNGAFRVKVVRVTDIYDEFNGGAVSPLAIRKFLSYAYHNWSLPPRYALIVAEGEPLPGESFRIQDRAALDIALEHSYVPSILMQTVAFGATPCDYLLGCFDGSAIVRTSLVEGGREVVTSDLLPEVIIGRVAITAIHQFGAYVDKVIAQTGGGSPGEWRGRALFIGGFEPVQSAQINQLASDLRDNTEPIRFLTADSYAGTSVSSTRRGILASIRDGAGLITYLGHGGGGQWEAGAELGISNAETVENIGRMGTILSLTCFTGAYNVTECLLGRLMVSPKGGAISAYGTPGFGWLHNNGYMAEGIFTVLSDPRFRDLSVGELLALGKARYIGAYQARFPDHVPTMVAMFTIFGDPSLPVPLSLDTMDVASPSLSAIPGGQISATALAPFAAQHVTATVFDTTEMHLRAGTASATLAGNRITVNARVPDGYGQQYIGIRVYAWDDAGHGATGTLRVATGDGAVGDVRPIDPFVPGQDARFEVRLRTASTAVMDSIRVTLTYSGVIVLDRVGFALRMASGGVYVSDPVPAALVQPGAVFDLDIDSLREVTGRAHRTFWLPGGANPAAYRRNGTDSTRPWLGAPPRLAQGSYSNETIRLVQTPAGARLAAMVYNWGDRDARDVRYRIIADTSSGVVTVATGTIATIAAGDSVAILHDIGWQTAAWRTLRLILGVDSVDHWSDVDLRNNEAFAPGSLAGAAVKPGLGITRDGTTPTAWQIPSVASVVVDGATSSTGLVVAIADTALPPTRQPWTFLRLGSGASGAAAVRFVASDTSLGGTVTFRFDPRALAGRTATVVRYDPTTRLWLGLASSPVDSVSVSARVQFDGTYSVAIDEDRVPPTIKFSVEGQFFVDSSAVARDARFSAVASDPSGIDPSRLSGTIDGVALQRGTEVVWLDSTITPTTANLRIQKDLGGGRHTLCVSAADRFGNSKEECTTFEVETELALKLYGNFPNPFAAETFVGYEIRGATRVDEVEVKIFSTSGRLVRTFRFPSAEAGETEALFKGGTGVPTSIGYHEVWWDGSSDRGEQVANGVYFYRVRVKSGGETVEETSTMARIR